MDVRLLDCYRFLECRAAYLNSHTFLNCTSLIGVATGNLRLRDKLARGPLVEHIVVEASGGLEPAP